MSTEFNLDAQNVKRDSSRKSQSTEKFKRENNIEKVNIEKMMVIEEIKPLMAEGRFQLGVQRDAIWSGQRKSIFWTDDRPAPQSVQLEPSFREANRSELRILCLPRAQNVVQKKRKRPITLNEKDFERFSNLNYNEPKKRIRKKDSTCPCPICDTLEPIEVVRGIGPKTGIWLRDQNINSQFSLIEHLNKIGVDAFARWLGECPTVNRRRLFMIIKSTEVAKRSVDEYKTRKRS
ncbi:hypothetical protein ACOME3_005787 [Neoechinorhynchus agilis]